MLMLMKIKTSRAVISQSKETLLKMMTTRLMDTVEVISRTATISKKADLRKTWEVELVMKMTLRATKAFSERDLLLTLMDLSK